MFCKITLAVAAVLIVHCSGARLSNESESLHGIVVAQWNLGGVNTNPLEFTDHAIRDVQLDLAGKFKEELDLAGKFKMDLDTLVGAALGDTEMQTALDDAGMGDMWMSLESLTFRELLEPLRVAIWKRMARMAIWKRKARTSGRGMKALFDQTCKINPRYIQNFNETIAKAWKKTPALVRLDEDRLTVKDFSNVIRQGEAPLMRNVNKNVFKLALNFLRDDKLTKPPGIRRPTLTKLTPVDAEEILMMLSPPGDLQATLWDNWVSQIVDVLENGPPGIEDFATWWSDVPYENIYGTAFFDALLFQAGAKLLAVLDSNQRSQLLNQIGTYVKGFGTSIKDQCDNLRNGLAKVEALFRPDMWTLEEFQQSWIESSGPCAKLKEYWDTHIATTFDVRRGGDPTKQTVLLARIDTFTFVEEARRDMCGEDNMCGAAHYTRTDEANTKMLLVAGHASSDGSTCALLVKNALAARKAGEKLILGLDANSLQVGGCKSANCNDQLAFAKLLKNTGGVHHCFEHLDVLTAHTVKKERTYIQGQWYKAHNPDISLKDWVVTTLGPAFGVRVNHLETSDTAESLKGDVASESWAAHVEGKLFLKGSSMPRSGFTPDHALVIARIEE